MAMTSAASGVSKSGKAIGVGFCMVGNSPPCDGNCNLESEESFQFSCELCKSQVITVRICVVSPLLDIGVGKYRLVVGSYVFEALKAIPINAAEKLSILVVFGSFQ